MHIIKVYICLISFGLMQFMSKKNLGGRPDDALDVISEVSHIEELGIAFLVTHPKLCHYFDFVKTHQIICI